ncbi:MAG: 5-bromo-4-chloroindolyl phosphate hydrolysis family protein [Candidatus Enterenecus sp.]
MASNQTNHNGPNGSGQGWQYNYNYNHGTNGPNSGPPKKNPNWGEWIPIVILFLIPSGWTQVIAAIWALSKISRIVRIQSAQSRSQVRQAAAQQAPQQEARQTSGGPARQKSSGKASKGKQAGGIGLIIAGAILTGIFGLGTIGTLSEFLSSLFYGYFFSDELMGVITCAMFLACGLVMLCSGIGSRRRQERYLNYLAYIGANREVDLAHMASAFNISVRKLCKDLQKMLSAGVLPTGYLDLAAGKLFLTEMGYRAPEPEQKREPTPQEQAEQEDAILREIRQVNDAIPDAAMSAKIDRIEEITGKILAYQKAHPDREGQLRTFLNYYLPTTLKILRAYAQLEAQGVEGENISAAKARIEGMMDQVVSGFEKQLDKLFQDDAMDISSDVQVLENMLKKDGLSDDQQGMTMTL